MPLVGVIESTHLGSAFPRRGVKAYIYNQENSQYRASLAESSISPNDEVAAAPYANQRIPVSTVSDYLDRLLPCFISARSAFGNRRPFISQVRPDPIIVRDFPFISTTAESIGCTGAWLAKVSSRHRLSTKGNMYETETSTWLSRRRTLSYDS